MPRKSSKAKTRRGESFDILTQCAHAGSHFGEVSADPGRRYFRRVSTRSVLVLNQGSRTTNARAWLRILGLTAMDQPKKLRQVIEHYRQLACEADCMAAADVLPPKYRDAYRNMARHWSALAEELEECLDEEEVSLH